MESRFCYEIHKNVGLANNRTTGENAKVFAEVKIQHDKQINDEAYKVVHEEYLIMLSEQLNITPNYIKPISIEEFEKEHG